MCIIIYKPTTAAFPSKKTLKTCFRANPDGAGYMTTDGGRVHIKKGFMTFSAFWKSLQAERHAGGDERAFVLHFRIGTQGGTRADLTHPFPLSDNMRDLRALDCLSNIGIAHNGIISLTSSGYFGTAVDYSDSMRFIVDYMSLIIRGSAWWKNDKNIKLVERLTPHNRFAVMDGGGHVTLTGAGWIEDSGCYYSNESYKPADPLPRVTAAAPHWWEVDDYGDGVDDYVGTDDRATAWGGGAYWV